MIKVSLAVLPRLLKITVSTRESIQAGTLQSVLLKKGVQVLFFENVSEAYFLLPIKHP